MTPDQYETSKALPARDNLFQRKQYVPPANKTQARAKADDHKKHQSRGVPC